jgi:hypothetical protein
LAHLRKTETNPVNYRAAVSGFLAEIDRFEGPENDESGQLCETGNRDARDVIFWPNPRREYR